MTSKDIKTVELIVNSDQAKAKLEELNKKLDTMKQKREDALNRADSKALSVYSREVSKLEKEIQRTETRAQGMSKALANLDKSTPNELQRTLRELTRELNSGKIERGSKEWNVLTEAIRSTKDALRDVNEEMAVSDNRSFSDKLADWGNKWFGLIENVETFAEVLGSVRETLHEVVNDFATMEEAQAQVRKYTGLSEEEVKSLNESLQAMDTRTSREQLNALAGDAGKLGITSKEQILDFVEAADQINVALGDDLGDGAVKNVGKLAMLFSEDQRLGLKGAMLATASVINELSQNSSAGARYLEEFTARVAGVGKQAGMTQAEIMGFAAVLDENMQQEETSATAFSQLITKLYQEPAKFAALSGRDVQEFTTLLKEDANEALHVFFQAMRDQGGFDKLAPMFTEMGLEGSRATAVLTSIADKLDNVRKMQRLASESYEEATSITREFGVQNTTVQAELDKARKAALDMRIELGEKLQPVAANMVNMTTMSLRLLSATIDFVSKNRKSVIAITAAIVTYTLTMKAAVLWENLHNGSLKAKYVHLLANIRATTLYKTAVQTFAIVQGLCTVAVTLFTKGLTAARIQFALLTVTMAKNPIGLLAVALSTVIGLVLQFTGLIGEDTEAVEENTKALEGRAKALEDCGKAQKDANTKYAEEEVRIQKLLKIIRDNSRSIKDRRAAIRELQSVVPDYHASLTSEGTLTERNTNAIKDYLVQLKKKALAEALYERLKETMAKKANADLALQAWDNAVRVGEARLKKPEYQSNIQQEWGYTWAGGLRKYDVETNPLYTDANKRLLHSLSRQSWWKNEQKNIENEIDTIINYAKSQGVDQMLEDLVATGGQSTSITNSNANGGGGGGAGGGSGKNNKNKPDPIKEAKERYEKEALAKKLYETMQFQEGKKTRKDYETALLQIEEDMITKQRDLYQKGSHEWNELEQSRLDMLKRQSDLRDQWSIRDIERQEYEARTAAQERYLSGTISEEEYQRELDEITLAHLRKREDYYESIGNEEQYLEWKEKADTEDLKQQLNRRQKYLQKAKALRQEYVQKTVDERQAEEEKLLDELIKLGLIKEEERQKFMEQIKKKYDKQRKEGKKNKDEADGKLSNPLSGNVDGMASDVIQMGKTLESLSKKIKDGEADWEDYAAVAVASLGFVNSAISAVSQLFQAEQQAQENAITERYDKEISKAGSNSIKGKKLEEQKQKELAAVKNKYRKKQMSMEIAQAVASTAMAAINAYASASKVNFILGPIAAAMALAAGAIQIAAIKKQHSAESSGYYVGGFTGGNSYRKEAGVVHEGEFVANHLAVNNPNVLPMLQFIDHAQKNNTIASVTSADVRRAVGGGGGWAETSRPKAGSPSQVQIIDSSSRETAEAIKRLNENLEAGIRASVAIDGQDGFERQWNRYNQMKKRK